MCRNFPKWEQTAAIPFGKLERRWEPEIALDAEVGQKGVEYMNSFQIERSSRWL